jgi:RND superfamily putative drug exporter
MAAQAPRKESLLSRWARYAARKHWRVLGGWLVILIAFGVLSSVAGGTFVDSFTIPGAESQKAVDLLEAKFPSQAGDSATAVFYTEAGINDPAIKTRIDQFLSEAAGLPEVAGVVSPYDMPGAISADGKYAYATIQYDKQASEVDLDNAKKFVTLVDNSGGDGLEVEAGGPIVGNTEVEFGGLSEIIGVVAAMIILIIAFGSVVAMGVPIVTALIGLFIGIMGTIVAANFWDMSTFTLSFLAMIGLGVGIDYSLFITTRFRQLLHSGNSVEDSVARAADTSGRAVAFAGIIVAIALLGLLAIGIPFVGALGIAAAIVVISAVCIAVGMVPAVLGALGHKIDRLKVPGFSQGHDSDTTGFWFRWSRRVQKSPLVYGGFALIVLLALAIPFFNIELGASDEGNNSAELHTRRSYDLLSAGFGPGFNGQFLVVVEKDGGLDTTQVDSLIASLQNTNGVVVVSPARYNEASDTAVITLTPSTSPQDSATTDLAKYIRSDVIPPAVDGTEMHAYLGGLTAANIDVADKIGDRMPLFFLIVIGLSFVVLTIVFRSIIIPIKAALLNLLSIGGAYGVVVLVFQEGWLKGVFGVEKEGPIESFLPMMLFAILFGLAMDYEVFLLSRIHEEYLHTKDATKSIETGLGLTARVIIAAATIMMAVFFSFVLEDNRIIKEFGLGLGVAILIEATLIRMFLFPSVMQLLGDRAWYIPRWLDRILPRLSIEGPADEVEHVPAERELVGAGSGRSSFDR